MRRRTIKSSGIALFFLLWVVPSALEAGRWDSKLERIEKKLEKGRWQDAKTACLKIRRRLVSDADRSDLALAPAARTLVLQAVAEAGLGRDEAARWYWLAAQSYLQGVPRLNLERFGRAGELLENLTVEELPEPWIAPASGADEAYKKVQVRSARSPIFPDSINSSPKGAVRLEIVVGIDGRAHRPKILDAGPVPIAAFPVLDAVRTWRFEPARRGDRPINVVYQLALGYP